MRLIDADALIEKWYEVNNIGPEDRGAIFIGYTEIPRFINNAPTVEPTGDYISRAAAKQQISEWATIITKPTLLDKDATMMVLDLLPSADAVQGEWIPVSERLPEEGQGVLVTVDANKWNIEVGSCIYSGGTFHSNFFDLEVIAWMPLPKPYKGGDDE